MAELLAGRVLMVAGPVATVEIDGEVLPPMQLARHLHGGGAAPGDACLVSVVNGSRVVTGVLGVAAAPPEPEPDPDGQELPPKPPELVLSGTSPVRPVWAGTYRNGWRGDTTDLYQGDWTGRGINRGAAYFGAAFQAWDEITRVRVGLHRLPGAGVSEARTPTMTLLAGGTRPSGAPVVLATASGPAMRAGDRIGFDEDGNGGWAVPSTWLSRLHSGEAGGIGIYVNAREPYLALSAAGEWMTARVDWRDE